jgi:hypothetical protein
MRFGCQLVDTVCSWVGVERRLVEPKFKRFVQGGRSCLPVVDSIRLSVSFFDFCQRCAQREETSLQTLCKKVGFGFGS